MDIEQVMNRAVPRVYGDAVRCIEIHFAFGQVKTAGAYDSCSCKSEQQVHDAAEHEKSKNGNPHAGSGTAPSTSACPGCSEQHGTNYCGGCGERSGGKGGERIDSFEEGGDGQRCQGEEDERPNGWLRHCGGADCLHRRRLGKKLEELRC